VATRCNSGLNMMAGERVQFAFRYNDQHYDAVMRFASELPSNEMKPPVACLDSVLARMNGDAPRAEG
jgi:hypothetical protein